MYQIGEFIVYKKNVCKIADIKKEYINDLDYYILISTQDPTLKIEIPTNSKMIRKPISKNEVENIINEIPNIQLIDVEERLLEQEYKKLLNTGLHADLLRIIKTTYSRNQTRLENKKKIGDKDNHYFEQAENLLYQEFSVVLGLTLEQTKNYVNQKVEMLFN